MDGRTRRITIAVIVLGILGASFYAFWRATAAGGAKTYVVTIEAMKFSPGVLELRLGDRVVFQNHDLVPHTATAKTNDVFDSGLLKAGDEWRFTPTRAGTTHYACQFHPTMEGSLVVAAPP